MPSFATGKGNFEPSMKAVKTTEIIKTKGSHDDASFAEGFDLGETKIVEKIEWQEGSGGFD